MTTVRPVKENWSRKLPNAVAVPTTHILEWLAISLTQGLGPTRARKLVEHFGSAEAVFHASLTELEGTGIQRFRRSRLQRGNRRKWRGKRLLGLRQPGSRCCLWKMFVIRRG